MPKLLFIIFFSIYTISVNSQSRKFYTIKDDNSYDKIVFKVKAESGNYKIKPSNRTNVIDIFGSPNHDNLNPSFTSKKINNRIRSVNFTVENLYDPILSNLIVNESNLWEFFINEKKTYDFSFNSKIADANINLSNIPIENIDLVSGNANLFLIYEENSGNPLQMDSLKIKIEIGSLNTKNINLSNAKTIFTEIGFGNVILDIADNKKKSFVSKTNLSAGQLIINLPFDDVDTKIIINNSPLSSVKLPKNFREIDENIFVNNLSNNKSTYIRSFVVDVGLGNITVNYKK